jgi:hypothetical protein
MRAIVHSIHSQVTETISSLTPRPKAIISLDSHLDVSLGGDLAVYPRELRLFAERTSVHAALCGVSGGMPAAKGSPSRRRRPPEVIVAIPERMLARHASDIEQKLPPTLRVRDVQESVSSVVDFLGATIGLEVYPSPPKSLAALASRVEGGGTWLLDVDVDYMREMQAECYTQIRNTAPGVLQSMANVLQLIEDSRPSVITISEVRVSAMRDAGSSFSRFAGALRDAGYVIEERGVYGSDEEVLRGISVCKEFYRTVSRRLATDHMDALMRGELAGFEREERATAREFFRGKGYSV